MLKSKVALFQEAIDGGQIRKTEDNRVSVIDVIEAMTPHDKRNAANTFANILNRFPEVCTKITHFQFPGRGQRSTPITDAEGMIYIMMLLPGQRAAQFRTEAAKLIVGYLNADIAIADNILQRSTKESAEWLESRARVKASRHTLTDAMKALGVTAPYMFSNAANMNNKALFGKSTKELKSERGVLDLRASLSGEELAALEFTERVQARKLAERQPSGNKEILAVCREVVENVAALRN
ncbi:MAG: hypothetical protein LUE17_08735 [Planctomycetaceae bacterium]|nr:hypothetical protein [Planctomycetaceae bacterium]